MAREYPEEFSGTALQAAVAATRFGYGAAPGDIARLTEDPITAVAAQVRDVDPLPAPLKDLPDTRALLVDTLRARRRGRTAFQTYRREARARAVSAVNAHLQAAASSPNQFFERLVAFWTNHFTISMNKPAVMPLVTAFEREAIRPNVMGSVHDLLLAVVRHPAMLIYLNNVRSVGPNSKQGRASGRGLNTDLARAILETHTYGPEGDITDGDVVTLAGLLSGWTVGLLGEAEEGAFRFRSDWHESGAKRFRGRFVPEAGLLEGEAALDLLARAPATGRRLSRLMAQFFIDDDPAESVEEAIYDGYTDGGSARGMAEGLLASSEAWTETQTKVKTPRDLAVSAARALGRAEDGAGIAHAMRAMGEPPYQATDAAGWPIETAGWIAGEQFFDRLDWCRGLAEQAGAAPGFNAIDCAFEAVGGLLREQTYRRMRVAFSQQEALALFFSSPEFQLR
ncbi:MAG: DUF1800 domain-containing protein [Alphaproteobacteria bacterium]|nr:DUF1800 domain-containing protein [Alphaproteobacteria bacterium]